jgi:uncharacterized protein YndB with AHSA1/START domain
MASFVARADIDIAAPAAQVWEALTDPEVIAQYFFGTRVETDWQVGSPIFWRGEYEGKQYEDKGEIVDVVPGRRLTHTHFSPLTGLPDRPENYHTVTYELEDLGASSRVSLSQDNNADATETERAVQTWSQVLDGLKAKVEQRHIGAAADS